MSEFYRYHYPSMTDVVSGMEEIERTTKNPEYTEPLMAIERCLYLVKVLQVLTQHRAHEPSILPCLRANLKYSCQRLYDVSGEAVKRHLLPALDALADGRPGADIDVMEALDQAVRHKYYWHRVSEVPASACSPTRWCMTRVIGLPEHVCKSMLDTLTTQELTCVVSLQYMANTIKFIVLAEDNVTAVAHDPDFNSFFNQAVYWVSALRVYEEVIFQRKLEEMIGCVLSLLKKQATMFFSWYDVKSPFILQENLVRFMEHLLRGVKSNVTDVELSQITTYIHHCKAVLQKL